MTETLNTEQQIHCTLIYSFLKMNFRSSLDSFVVVSFEVRCDINCNIWSGGFLTCPLRKRDDTEGKKCSFRAGKSTREACERRGSKQGETWMFAARWEQKWSRHLFLWQGKEDERKTDAARKKETITLWSQNINFFLMEKRIIILYHINRILLRKWISADYCRASFTVT